MSKEKPTMYICDPVKNTACRKTGCVHNPVALIWHCAHTKNPAFAVLDENGEPMLADTTRELVLPIFRDKKRLDQLSGKSDPPCR